MASSAVLRLAGRALRGLPSSFPRALVAVGERSLQHASPMPHQIMGPRRLYSTELNPKVSTLHQPVTLQNSGHQVAKKLTSEERVSTKLDKLASGYKEISDNHKRVGVILREKKERERRRLVLEGVVILTGLAFWLKRHFFPQNQEARTNVEGSNK